MHKIVFQVIQYKPFQILVESLWEKCLPVCFPFQDQNEFPGTRI